MQFFTLAVVLATAASVSAQSICTTATAAIPSCGIPCIASAAAAVGCAPGDLACRCTPASSSAIANSAIGCVIGACGIPTALQVQAAGQAVCTSCPTPR